jgi:hypothetical protein
MLLRTTTAPMFISLVGPPINEFKPEWLEKGHHQADYISCPPPGERSCEIYNSENMWTIF